jgi:hypothetical protein
MSKESSSFEIYEMELITKEVANYLAMKSYLEKNNLHHFTFSPNSKKPIEAIIRHLPCSHINRRYFQQP